MICADCILVMLYLISTFHFKLFIGGTYSYRKQTQKEWFLQSFFRIHPVIWKANMSEVLFFEVSVVDLVHRLEQPCLERLQDDSPNG